MDLRTALLSEFDYDADAGTLTRKRNGRPFGSLDKGRYCGQFQNRRYYLSHLIWLIETGALPLKRLSVFNGDTTDVRFGNLKDQSNPESKCSKQNGNIESKTAIS
jgi:hypothetical protein